MPLSRRALLSTAGATALVALAPPPAVAAPHRRHRGATTAELIPLQGAVNVRDLGGYLTYGGDRVRRGLVYRGDALGKLTDADLTTLSGLRLGSVVDFRVPLEVRSDGADRLPGGLVPVARPVTDNGLNALIRSAIGSGDPVKQEEMLGGGRAPAFMAEVYRSFVTSADNRARFAATIRDVARPGGRPLLYHCTSGKDRTGWLSYLLLTVVGVPERYVVEDFLASNTFRAAHDAHLREGLRQSGLMRNPELLIPMQEVRLPYLEAALAEVRRGYGGLFRYLTVGLGLEPRTLAELQDRLVD
ncbi:tyrosine-protein phosphatase [Streptomyces sp. NPDC090127]|uniref:tyrosine-protein phosphatase n=1 Tax=Streptomyces sp. NPDC090127 TaxID=3365953 RepID=UPI00381CA362